MPKTPTISIVDDDKSMRHATRRLLKSFGLDALTFASAEEYLDSGSLHETACLITDVQMPGLSGLDLQSLLERRGFDMPIVFMTAFPHQDVRARALHAGAVGFLGKPYDEKSLIDCPKAARGSEAGAAFGP